MAQTPSNYRARQLGRELARLRERARLTQAEAGEPVRFTHKKVSRIEKGQLPDFNGLRGLLDVYGLPVNDWPPYIRMWERARDKGWWHGYGVSDKGYVSLEHHASEVWDFQLSYIPGLLQTPDYVRALFSSPNSKRISKTAASNMEVRARRQDRLTADQPLIFNALIDESALRRQFPGKIMAEQLRYIVERAQLDSVSVRVIPSSAGHHRGMAGSFTLLAFPEVEEPDLVYLEHSFGAVHIDSLEQVRSASLKFKELTALSLSEADSIAFMERLAAEP